MQSLSTYLRHIPEGAETTVLVALSVPAVMLVIRVATGARWASSFTTALIIFTYASVAALPLIVLGSRLMGPMSLALCPPVVLIIALVALRPWADLPTTRKVWTGAAAALVLTGFGFVILVLPGLRMSLRPETYEDYRVCRQHLTVLGAAFTAYAGDHKNQFPDQEDARDVLTQEPPPSGQREGPYLADLSALVCPAAKHAPQPGEPLRSRTLGDYVYAQPARRDPPDTYVLRCRRHTRVRRFWTEEVGLYLRKDGKVDVIPLWRPPTASKRETRG